MSTASTARRRYQDRKARGICTDCGQRPSTTTIRCEPCRERSRVKMIAYWRQRNPAPKPVGRPSSLARGAAMKASIAATIVSPEPAEATCHESWWLCDRPTFVLRQAERQKWMSVNRKFGNVAEPSYAERVS